jgi:hypothetical protein
MDALADADSGGPHEAESVPVQGVGETKLLLQLSVGTSFANAHVSYGWVI